MKPFFKGGVDLCGFARGDWEPMPQPMIVDSGAAETVMPAHWLIGHKIHETEKKTRQIHELVSKAEENKQDLNLQKEISFAHLGD